MLLTDKNAVIYGAAGAIGATVARAFAAEGATVHLTGRNAAALDTVAKEITASGGTAHTAVGMQADDHSAGNTALAHTDVDSIPVVWIQPDNHDGDARIALWLPWLTGTKEAAIPFLRELAGRGFTAVSFDPWQHGERGTETAEQLSFRVFGDFRRHMWPILGQTTLDALRVADWAAAEFGVRDVAAGGVSTGGDIAVALAGIDQRISRVAAIAATPDWTRPGMRDIRDPSLVLPQGEPDAYAQWFYNHLDPLSHLSHYAHKPAIAFECGADDMHVPPDGALRFRDALAKAYPHAAGNVRVTLHPGIGHMDSAQKPALFQNCIAWLAEDHTRP